MIPGAGNHPHIRYTDVRVGSDALLGEPGKAFHIAQARLPAADCTTRCQHRLRQARIRHALRKSFVPYDFQWNPRRQSRRRAGIADSCIQLEQFRRRCSDAAWQMDTHGAVAAMQHVSACKVAMARVAHDVVERALHLHGALGASNETPLGAAMAISADLWAGMDGPTEVHQDIVAR